MPYIGNQHNVGDHVNNFKVLDDISSHTATFDGSASSVISVADDTIRIPEHRFIQGQRVTYTNGGGGNIGGLTTGTAYFVSFDSANTIKLATTLANANSNTVINLSAVGSGTSHTLNVAFDGVNTKFKITHGSGKAARLNNATQLNVAINNVIQRPNINSVSFTEGFAIEDNHKIVFKTAPTVNDVFWGSIIANTIENFDLRDNEVDNFTGDGSTTEFTLSTIPANNESVVVSINGVVQHPSDKNTARSYTLIDSIIQFTAAPALGDGIQVRHIGFAGASTNDVSGFYGRTGNVALTSSDHITTGDITSRNINSSGIITATTFSGGFSGNVVGTSATFTGNLSVGGVLTYEDVTNVDSVGIITAQKDIHVGAGISVVGVVTATTFVGALTGNVTGTASGNPTLANGADNRVITATGANAIQGETGLTFDGNNFEVTATSGRIKINSTGPAVNFIDTNADSDYMLQVDGGIFKLVDLTNSDAIRLQVASNGNVAIAKDLDVDGHTNLDNVSIAGVTTFAENVIAQKKLSFADSPYIGNTIPPNSLRFGDNDDFILYHTGSYSGIDERGGGNGGLVLHCTNNFTVKGNASNKNRIIAKEGGAVELYHNNVKRLETTNQGINVIGHSELDNVNISGVTTTAGNVDINADLDVDGHTNLDNVSIAGVTTFSGNLDANGVVYVRQNASPTIYITSNSTTGSGRLFFGDPDSDLVGRLSYVHNGDYFSFYAGYGERFRIAGNGDITVTSIDNFGLGPTLKLFHNSGSPAANDVVSRISMFGDDAAGNETEYGRIETVIDSTTDSQETGFLNFATRGLGSFQNVFRIKRRSTASAPSYSADDADGVILDVYNTGNPYPRYMNFIAKSAGNTDSNIGFWTEEVGGSPTEKLRITSDGRIDIGGFADSSSRLGVNASSTAELSNSSGLYNQTNPAFLQIKNSTDGISDPECGIVLQPRNSGNGAVAIYAKRTGTYTSDLIYRTRTGANASAERLRIKSDGKVGINQSNPDSRLHVVSSSNHAATFEYNSTSDCAIQVKNTQGSMFFGLGGGEEFAVATDSDLNGSNSRFVIKQDGKTGINNTSPARTLDIKPEEGATDSNLALTCGNATGYSQLIFANSSDGYRGGLYYYHNDDRMTIYGGAGQRDIAEFEAPGSTSYMGVGNILGQSSNDGSWNARFNLYGSQHAKLELFQDANDVKMAMWVHTGHQQGYLSTLSNHDLYLTAANNNAKSIIINTDGQVRKQSQPSFASYYAGSQWNVSNGSVMVFNATRHNIGNHYNTGNGRFTAPVAGSYQFNFFSIYINSYNDAYTRLRVDGSRIYGGDCHFTTSQGSNWHNLSWSQVLYLNENEYVDIVSYTGTGSGNVAWHGNHWQCWSGWLLG